MMEYRSRTGRSAGSGALSYQATSARIELEGRLEFFRRNRWQTLAGVFGSSIGMLGTTWPALDDHTAMLIFVGIHQLTFVLLAVAFTLPFRGSPLERFPRVSIAALAVTAVTMSSGIFVVPSAAQELEFTLGIGIVLFCCVGGVGITLGPVPLLARAAMVGLTVPYAIGCFVFGHWAIGLGTVFFLVIVAGLGVHQMDVWFKELVELRTAETYRASEAEEAANTDLLTGLASRQGLQAVDGRAFRGELIGLFIDLDYFKSVNDTFGHAAGDEVLKVIGTRLRTVFRSDDTIARIGGDEFFVLAGSLPLDEAEALAVRAIEVIQEPIVVAGDVTRVSASIGIARETGPNLRLERLINEADQALYRAKRGGRSRIAKA